MTETVRISKLLALNSASLMYISFWAKRLHPVNVCIVFSLKTRSLMFDAVHLIYMELLTRGVNLSHC